MKSRQGYEIGHISHTSRLNVDKALSSALESSSSGWTFVNVIVNCRPFPRTNFSFVLLLQSFTLIEIELTTTVAGFQLVE